MGAACCNIAKESGETGHDVKIHNAEGNLDDGNFNNNAESGGKHAPSDSTSTYVPLEMTRITEVKTSLHDSNAHVNQIEAKPEFRDLPTLGPYQNKSSNTLYHGQYKDGNKHGLGLLIWPDNNTYYGEFKNDMTNGKGMMAYQDKSVYFGDWVDDKAHGSGTFQDEDGVKYEGAWENDYR